MTSGENNTTDSKPATKSHLNLLPPNELQVCMHTAHTTCQGVDNFTYVLYFADP